MGPDPANAELAAYAFDELLSAVPEAFGLKKLSRRVLICLLDDNVRVAFMFVNLFYLGRYGPSPLNKILGSQNNHRISILC